MHQILTQLSTSAFVHLCASRNYTTAAMSGSVSGSFASPSLNVTGDEHSSLSHPDTARPSCTGSVVCVCV